MALLERLEIVIEADARTAEREFDRIGRQAEESLKSIETAAGEVGDNASKKLAGAAPEFARAGEKLSDAAGEQLDLSAAAQEAAADVSRALESRRQEAGQSGRRLGDSAGRGVADGVRDAGSQVRAAGGDVGAAAGDGVSGGLLESIGGIGPDLTGAMDDVLGALPAGLAGPVAAAGALIGAGLVNGISDAIQNESLGDVIAARVGEGAAESERFARVTSEVFRDAWGESTAEVADAVDAVYSTLSDARGSEEALERLTAKAQALSDVFAVDVQQSVQAAGQLVFNGLAEDADQAFDLITAGLQNVGAATRDELLDAIAEYGNDFADVGIDGEKAMAILVSAADGGSMAVDNAGDSVKELSVRVANLGDEVAQSALGTLGLDAQDMAAKMAAGGDTAEVATQQIAEALLRVEDPAKRYELAVDLMGGPIENVGRVLLPDFLEALSGSSTAMRDAAGASDELTDSLANTETSLTTLKRELLGGFEDLADNLLAPAAAVADGETSWQELGTALGDAFMEGIGLTPLGDLAEAPLRFWADMLGVDNQVDILGLILGGGTTPSGDNSFLWERLGLNPGGAPDLGLDEIPADAGRAKVSLEQVNDEIELSGELMDLAADRADNFLSRLAGTTNLDDAISAQLSLRDAATELADGLGALQGVDIEKFADGTIQVSDEAASALGDISGAASAAQQQIANALEWEGEAGALETAGELRDRFVELFDAAGLSDEQIIDLLGSMGLLPEQITTAIELSGADEALAKLDLLSDRYEEEIPSEVQTQIDIAIAEGRFVDAANLLSLWVKDKEDGFINDPLLVAMGLGDTGPASSALGEWKLDEEGKPPVEVPVNAETTAARARAAELFNDIQRLNPTMTVKVAANLANLATAIPILGNGFIPPGRPRGGGRATGGPVLSGVEYPVNEVGAEMFVPSTPGFVMDHSESRALIEGVRQLLNGGGTGMTVNQQITSTDPVVTAREAARKMRDAQYLAGV